MYFSYVWGQINFCTPEPCPKGDHVDIGVGTWGGKAHVFNRILPLLESGEKYEVPVSAEDLARQLVEAAETSASALAKLSKPEEAEPVSAEMAGAAGLID